MLIGRDSKSKDFLGAQACLAHYGTPDFGRELVGCAASMVFVGLHPTLRELSAENDMERLGRAAKQEEGRRRFWRLARGESVGYELSRQEYV